MAGTVVVDAVKSSTTGAPTFQNTSGTEIGQLAKAWVNFNGSNGSIFASFNVSSVTRTGTGRYTASFSSAFADTSYVVTSTSDSWFAGYITKSTGSITLANNTGAGAASDCANYSVAFFR